MEAAVRAVALWLRGCRAMGVLTAGSPCAVVLVPLAYVCSIATITRKGVIVKSAQAVDALLSCHTVALDKTGVLVSWLQWQDGCVGQLAAVARRLCWSAGCSGKTAVLVSWLQW